jgi:hypothetical protein
VNPLAELAISSLIPRLPWSPSFSELTLGFIGGGGSTILRHWPNKFKHIRKADEAIRRIDGVKEKKHTYDSNIISSSSAKRRLPSASTSTI